MPSSKPSTTESPLRGRHRLPQILTSAAAGFAQKGYDGASIADLTAWTGLGRGALYRQIGSKLDLLRTIAERYVTAVEEAVAQVDGSATPQDVLHGWSRSVFATQADLYDFARVFYNERRALETDVGIELDQRLKAVGRPALEAIAELCPGADADLGQAFLGMVFGSYLWFRPEQDADMLAAEACELFIEGVRGLPRTPRHGTRGAK